jgi:hypothetical protein
MADSCMKGVEEGAKAKAKRASCASGPRKLSAKGKTAANAGTKAKSRPKAKPGASEAKPIKLRKGEKVVLLSGGNPQIAKADGDAPVQAYIAAMPGWKRDLGKRLDALIVRNVPNVRKAVKWNSPFYGIEGQGWFLSFHVFTHYVKVSSSAARRCDRSRLAPASTRACATSTSTKATSSTRRRWRTG